MAPPRGVAAPAPALAVWAALTALLAGVASLGQPWLWWVAPVAWGALPVAWWILKGPPESWGVGAPGEPKRDAIELALGTVLVAGAAALPAYLRPPAVWSASVVVLLCLWGPLVEELFFRGFLQGALRPVWGAGGAIAAGALLFGVSHALVERSWLGLATALPAVLYGVFRERTGSIWPSVILHSASNAALLLWSQARSVAA